jgi:hypothetical protein
VVVSRQLGPMMAERLEHGGHLAPLRAPGPPAQLLLQRIAQDHGFIVASDG